MILGLLRTFAIVILAAALVVPLPSAVLPVAQADDTSDTVTYIVKLAESGSLDWHLRRDLHDLSADIRRLSSRAPASYHAANSSLRQARDLRRYYSITVLQENTVEVRQLLEQHQDIETVREEQWYEPVVIPNDPRFTEQYGLSGTALADIKAPQAWDTSTGSSSTVIAIVDGGVDLAHEDLAGKVWQNGGEVAGNNIDDDGNGYIDDMNGWDFVLNQPAAYAIDHGTHVAGIAAGAGNNGVGVAGVDWGARIMSVRILANAALEGNVARGIVYAAENGADVINLSLAGPASEVIAGAIEQAYAQGVVVVAAAGNSGRDTSNRLWHPVCAEPADVNMVIGVAATDEEGRPASFSNYGDCIDIAAPGDDIISTRTGNRYGEMTGTSMSAPFVAGAAGLYLAVHPNASPAEVAAAVTRGDSFVGKNDAETATWNANYKGKLNLTTVVGSPAGAGNSSDNGGSSNEGSSGGDNGSNGSSGGGGGGGGGDDGGSSGGGGGGGGDEESSAAAAPASKPARVAGATTAAANLALIPRINSAFRSVFSRNPNVSEHTYWLGRVKRGEKRTYDALQGAMRYQQLLGRTYDSAAPTAVRQPSSVPTKAGSTSLIARLNALHRSVYGRNPSLSEHTYWLGRVASGEKSSEIALLGAMTWHRLAGISH